MYTLTNAKCPDFGNAFTIFFCFSQCLCTLHIFIYHTHKRPSKPGASVDNLMNFGYVNRNLFIFSLQNFKPSAAFVFQKIQVNLRLFALKVDCFRRTFGAMIWLGHFYVFFGSIFRTKEKRHTNLPF